ncbi:MAG TPA: hypothetical protein VGR69_10890 [Candidatus Rubrimentiphilum sp.]|nr:hypothetical protein [Candidatus Rubrimentiphilum sp.]
MRLCLISAILVLLSQPAYAATSTFHVTVGAKANIFGAGAGGVNANGGGTAPVKIPIPTGANAVEVAQAVGMVSCGGGCGLNGANGGPFFRTNIQSSGGVSGIIGPVNMFLVGVFVGLPSPAPPGPSRLDVTAMRRIVSVSPQLNQTFFVGTGKAAKAVRRIRIPSGARYFLLGFADGNGVSGPPGAYNDNTGALNVRGSFLGAVASNKASVIDIAGPWRYSSGGYGVLGKAQIAQRGTNVIIYGTWTPNSAPAPHYIIKAILSGYALNGTWRCMHNACQGSGRWHATINAAANRIVVSNSYDPGGLNINTTVLMRP